MSLKRVRLFRGEAGFNKHADAKQARIVSVYRPFFRYFRSLRLKEFYSYFGISDCTRILDVGGNPFFWRLAQELEFPAPKVTIVNLEPPWPNLPANVKWLVGDGTNLGCADDSFDIVFCNSVIEHLKDEPSQMAMAHEIRRVAARHFVQTPSRTFFIEPHLMAPFFHWLPLGWRKKLVRNFTGWGLIERPTQDECEKLVDEIRLLKLDDMRCLFPDSQIVAERFLGMTKSIIAVKT